MPATKETGRRPLIEGLLGVSASGVAAAERVLDLAVSAIRPNPHQPRRDFPVESIMELAGSIKAHGLQQPIVVRPLDRPTAPGKDNKQPAYELVMGERRLRACQAAGLKTIQAIVREVPDGQMLRLAFVENIHREDLPLLDRAAAFCGYADEFHAGKVEPAAEELRISRATGFNYKRIGSADPKYKGIIKKHGLDIRNSKFLLSLADNVARQIPNKVEAFDKALGEGQVGFSALKRLHDDYFPSSAHPGEEKRHAHAKDNQEPRRTDGRKSLYRKEDDQFVLEIRYHKRLPQAQRKQLHQAWSRAATKFFRDAGFRMVKIEF